MLPTFWPVSQQFQIVKKENRLSDAEKEKEKRPSSHAILDNGGPHLPLAQDCSILLMPGTLKGFIRVRGMTIFNSIAKGSAFSLSENLRRPSFRHTSHFAVNFLNIVQSENPTQNTRDFIITVISVTTAIAGYGPWARKERDFKKGFYLHFSTRFIFDLPA